MNLLTITEDESLGEKFGKYFEEVDVHSIRDVKIDVDHGEVSSHVNGKNVKDYSALFISPTPKAINFTKIFLETLTEGSTETNMDGTSYYMIAKKPYLFKVLSEKGVSMPRTYVVSSYKSMKRVQQEFSGNIVCKQFEGFVQKDIMKTDDPEDIKAFSENMEHGKNYMVVQDFLDGEVYDCLYIDGEIVSTRIKGDTWRRSPGRDGCNEKYHKPPNEFLEVVRDAADAIGSRFCSVRLVGPNVVDMKMNPDLDRFKRVSGKDPFKKVAEMLKTEDGGESE